MSDNTRRVSRRTALKGIAAVASTGAVGAGGIIHASEPAAATGHVMSIDDLTVETIDGDITELGISDLWFEISWENFTHNMVLRFNFRPQASNSDHILDWYTFNVNSDGTETFGYGEEYAEMYNQDLGSSIDVPLSTTDEIWLQEYFSLADDEEEKTVQDMEFDISVYSENEAEEVQFVDRTTSQFDLTVQRIEPDGEVSDGEGDAFGEG